MVLHPKQHGDGKLHRQHGRNAWQQTFLNTLYTISEKKRSNSSLYKKRLCALLAQRQKTTILRIQTACRNDIAMVICNSQNCRSILLCKYRSIQMRKYLFNLPDSSPSPSPSERVTASMAHARSPLCYQVRHLSDTVSGRQPPLMA